MDTGGRPLSEQGIERVGRILGGVGNAELWSVITVETQGCGFLPDRRPLILFERHIFNRRTGGRFDTIAPDLSSSRPGGYGQTGAYQHSRLSRAIKLDRIAALESTSWGLGQVMGYHAKAVGYSDVTAMVSAMEKSEDDQFLAMANFIVHEGLHIHLQKHNWAEFAYRYNGAHYKTNEYDTRLKLYYENYSSIKLPDLKIRTAQLFLTYCGWPCGAIDGRMGSKTIQAIKNFQAKNGLPATGVLDEKLLALLEEKTFKVKPVLV